MSDESINPPEDQERVSRLSSASSGDETVREYERRYSREPFDFPSRPAASLRELPRSYSTLRVSDDEKLWAAVAHGSVWVTLLGGVLSGGAVIPLSVFIPLVIYFLFRQKSDYVAFHALQAFVLQLIGTVGAFLLLLVGGLVWGIGMVIALLAVVLLVGFILVPFWGIVGVLLLGTVVVMPIAMMFFGTYAAIETYNGRDYRYPFIARWVDRQLAGSFLHTA
ncbi:MAG: DUF4870 domain-containing protein [Anaerolineae bacterium]|nr:DUF4870 domain-containing protein [Anaerolineae bacterium]